MTTQATIHELAPGGDGVAIVEHAGERRAVFVAGVAEGERVTLDVDFKARPARARLVSVDAPSPDRVRPACPDVARCGGCDYMHLSEAAQLRAHAEQVRRVLPAAWQKVEIAANAAPCALGYRTRARLHVSVTGGRATVGIHAARSHAPASVATCAVLAPALDRARGELAAIFEGAHGRGEATLGLGAFDARLPVLGVTWSGTLAAPVFARLERAVADGALGGARIAYGDATRPAVIGDATPWAKGGDGAPLRLSSGGFSQASEAQNERLARRVAELVAEALPRGGEGTRKVAELYAGAGNFTVLLARTGADVVSVESDGAACEAARENLAARGLSARVVCADAASYAWHAQTRIVVLDPPRTGARSVAAAIAAKPPRHVVYVSCDAPTLGRDLAVIAAAGYVPRAVETFEMFPQTSHVEIVVALDRVKRSS